MNLMAMRKDFCAFILSHKRPDRVHTYKTLIKSGYTGKIYIVIDDEDSTADEYRKLYGDKVLQFCKREVAKWTDDGDNFGIRGVVYARNVCWELAKQVGCNYFIVLDDDYNNFELRHRSDGSGCYIRVKKTLDEIITAMVDFLIATNTKTIAMAQGGDFLGGSCKSNPRGMRRKAMNTFICSTERPFKFFGHINEDVNAYVTDGRKGDLFFTIMTPNVVQTKTQENSGGLTEFYLDVGTYVKSFYSVMYAPSCVQIGEVGDPRSPHYRIHHKINWHKTAPKIIRETHRKTCQSATPD
jgi:hypothetical protein